MVIAFKNPLKKMAKDSNAEALKKGDKFNYLGTPYIVVSNEGKYTNSQGGTFVDLRVKEIDSITGKGRGERLLSLRA
jgi:translation elongation factor P/translation initiation factor 5A